jgi:hypothetical protein
MQNVFQGAPRLSNGSFQSKEEGDNCKRTRFFHAFHILHLFTSVWHRLDKKSHCDRVPLSIEDAKCISGCAHTVKWQFSVKSRR